MDLLLYTENYLMSVFSFFIVVLGNAYLSLFFFAGQNPGSLKQCMAAYKRAVSWFLVLAQRTNLVFSATVE